MINFIYKAKKYRCTKGDLSFFLKSLAEGNKPSYRRIIK